MRRRAHRRHEQLTQPPERVETLPDPAQTALVREQMGERVDVAVRDDDPLKRPLEYLLQGAAEGHAIANQEPLEQRW